MASYTSPIPLFWMAEMNGLSFLSKASTKFFHEVAPVALASVIGTIVVNHYSHSTEPPPAVVQPPPQAIVQALRDEHQLIIDYLRRDAEAKQAKSDRGGQAQAGPAAPAAKDGPAKPRIAFEEKAAPRPRLKAEKAADPLPLGPDLANLPAPETPPTSAGLIGKGSNMASAVGDFVVAAWRYPAQSLPKLSLADLPAAPWPFAWADGAFRSQSDVRVGVDSRLAANKAGR
jgi:hypothetical protein